MSREIRGRRAGLAALATLALAAGGGHVGADCGPPDPGRPRTGLVLSGGGARGLAHIGVLAVLEEHGLAADCIAGTSMGAAIGALSASGYSAREIADIVQSIDWEEVFSGRRVRSLVPLSRRVDDVPPVARVGLARGRVRLPASRDSDYRLNRLLFRLLAAAGQRAGGDFDRLAVPFRAVATDLATVEPVVLATGSLPRAVRASMSVPLALPTVTMGDRVLVDGGIVDNVPVDVARAMGADLVVAVDTTSPPLPREQWGTLLGVGTQLVDALSQRHARAWAQEPDLRVVPALEGRGNQDYSDPVGLIAAGRAAAEALLPQLRAMLRPRAAREAGAPVAVATVTAVVVRGARAVSERSIRAAFGFEAPDAFDGARLVRGMDRVWAMGLFDSVWLDLEPQAGGVAAVLGVTESLRAAIELGSVYDETNQVNAFARLRNRNLLGHGERLDLTLRAGARESGASVTLLGDALWRRGPGYLAGAEIREDRPAYYVDGDEIGRASFTRQLAFAGGQAGFGPDVLLQARLEAGRVTTDDRPGLALPRGTDQHRMVRGLAAWDRLDDPDLPERGAAVVMRAERSLPRLGASREYWRASADARAAWSPGADVVLDVSARIALSGRDVPAHDLHRLGGPAFLPGRAREELWGRQVLGLAASIGRDVSGFRVFVAAGAGNAWQRREDVSLRGLKGGAGAGVSRATPLGPVVLQAGRGAGEGAALYLSIGRH